MQIKNGLKNNRIRNVLTLDFSFSSNDVNIFIEREKDNKKNLGMKVRQKRKKSGI